jgi:hypothetical protein
MGVVGNCSGRSMRVAPDTPIISLICSMLVSARPKAREQLPTRRAQFACDRFAKSDASMMRRIPYW